MNLENNVLTRLINHVRRNVWKRILYVFKQIFNALKQTALLRFNYCISYAEKYANLVVFE